MNEQALNPDPAAAQTFDPQTLNLRDIHLPEAVSWWPPAAGWWLLLAGFILLLIIIVMARKIYLSRQLKRDISSEIKLIKQQFQQTQNKSELAKALSVLLRRASISYFPGENIAGLTGENWLALLDKTSHSQALQFQSDTGKALITAPYQTAESLADFDAQALIQLCESWLLSTHAKQSVVRQEIKH